MFHGLTNQWSPCSDANGVVGDVTVKFPIELNAPKSGGYAMLQSGNWKDPQSGEDIDDAATLSFKWYIRKCSS